MRLRDRSKESAVPPQFARARSICENKRKTKEALCTIVGIGGSAGGFEAAMELLHHLPPSTGMAFVVVHHLDPHQASRLPKLLGKVTAMPVLELAEPTTPRPNTVRDREKRRAQVDSQNASAQSRDRSFF